MFEEDGEEDRDEEASESESGSEEDEDVKLTEPSKNSIYNRDGLLDKLGDICWPENAGWIHRLSVDVNQEQEVDVNDDLTREAAFVMQTLEGTKEAFEKLKSMKINCFSPPDYYAEMVKTDSPMEKVKGKLLSEKRKIEEAEERRKARESKKLSKEIQAQKQKERAKQKKEEIESVKKWRKQRQQSGFAVGEKDADMNLPFEDGKTFERSNKKRPGVAPGDSSGGQAKRGVGNPNKQKKREFRNSKFGSGGRKGLKKQNTAETTDDIRSFNGGKFNIHLWKLSYRLWNSCVELSNLNSKLRSFSSSSFAALSLDLAKLRHITANVLSLAGNVSGVPSPSIKSASFYYKTGLIWHDLRRFDLASSCFEKASDLLSNSNAVVAISADDATKLLLDVNLARSRIAWELSDALLSRSKTLLLCSNYYEITMASGYWWIWFWVHNRKKRKIEVLGFREFGYGFTISISPQPYQTPGFSEFFSKSSLYVAMFDSMFDSITQAASNSLFIFCFCNLIIAILLMVSKSSSELGQQGEIPLSVVINTCTNHKQGTYGKQDFDDNKMLRNVDEVSYPYEAPVFDKEESGNIHHNKDEEEDDDDDELRRRVEEFIEKVNKEWKAESLRSSRLV
ncbi:hypothetical protein SO802_004235 [Lithocarpus litseifolius]|uniref:Uncharacterized protein n=1 Tax=Lithocarpus litseifolius TaxID=425828 RepID=A0AAW2E813_9ROSI